MSKEILELLKGSLKKIISHLELPEPKFMHPQVEVEKIKMERKYKTESENEDEMTNMLVNLKEDIEEMR